MYGPYCIGNTASILGVFSIFAVLKEIVQWGKTDYASWLQNAILIPLGAQTLTSAALEASAEAGPSTF